MVVIYMPLLRVIYSAFVFTTFSILIFLTSILAHDMTNTRKPKPKSYAASYMHLITFI